MGIDQPWMYDAEVRNDSRFPNSTFDPKAVTRASWEPKPPKPKQNGPLLSFNRHPDAQMILTHRANPYTPMSTRTKKWINWLRRAQLLFRILELNGAIGILAVMVLLTKVDPIKAWVMRIAPGIVIGHCLYSIYHHSRHSTGRTPTSSAAYQIFSAAADALALGLYGFSTYTTHQDSAKWSNRLPNREELTETFVQAVYYGMVGVGGLHVVSFLVSFWLSWAFHRISSMPPDMNPLEDNLTARPKHKRNKSSMTTLSTNESEKRLSTPFGYRPHSGTSYTSSPRAPTIPFMHTRTGSTVTVGSRDFRGDLPSRQYQVVPGNSPRSSAMNVVEPKRMSHPVSSHRGSYAGLPIDDADLANTGPISPEARTDTGMEEFTEAWAPTDSLISRNNERNHDVVNALRGDKKHIATYSALEQRYDVDESDGSDFDDENDMFGRSGDLSQASHPNPLASNPLASSGVSGARAQTPYHPLAIRRSADQKSLSEMHPNRRDPSGSRDIADKSNMSSSKPWGRQRDSSIQHDNAFYSKPYGELKSATPPIIVGGDRKVSSGNDYGLGKYSSATFERRNVSGKVAEEGRVGNRASRFGYYSSMHS